MTSRILNPSVPFTTNLYSHSRVPGTEGLIIQETEVIIYPTFIYIQCNYTVIHSVKSFLLYHLHLVPRGYLKTRLTDQIE